MGNKKFEPVRSREKILIYGSYKLGKSTCWVDIANRYFMAGNTDVHFYIIDTDYGALTVLEEGYQHLDEAGMLTIYNPSNFAELLAEGKEIHKKARPGDWIVIDMLSYPWTQAQEFYMEGVFGSDPETYFLQMRKEVVAKKGKDKRAYGGFEGTDWNFISKIYRRWEWPLTMQTGANVIAITEERKLDAERGASPDQIKQYKNVGGMAPVGQKGIGHRFDTVLRMTKRANGQRQITMAGDRGRERTWGERGSVVLDIGEGKKDGFAGAYLVDVVGWDDGKVREKNKQPAKRKQATRRKR